MDRPRPRGARSRLRRSRLAGGEQVDTGTLKFVISDISKRQSAMSSLDLSAGVNSESAAMRSQRHSTSPCIWRRCTSIPNATSATKDSWGRVNSPGTLPSLLRHFYSSACAFVLNRYVNNIATSPQGFLFYFISDAGCTGTVAPPPPPHVTQIVTVRRRWKDGRQSVASVSHKSKQLPIAP